MTTPKTILITGGTQGLGRETAIGLAQQGHCVYAASRKAPAEALPGVTYMPLDVRSAESIRACVEGVLAREGKIDVLINNAGYVGPAGASEEVSLEDARALFETNFFGVVQMTNAVLPALRQRRQGLIINVSSAAGRMAMPPFFGFYAASKHALEGYSEALSCDLRPLGIRVAVVEPGYFQTNIHSTFNPPANRLEDYAAEREHGTRLDEFCIRHGRDPRQVAQLISRLVNGTPRRLRYPIGLDVQFSLFMRAVLPEKGFELWQRWLTVGGGRIKLGDNDDTIRRKLGIRRYMLESRLADRLNIGAWVVLGLAALIIVLLMVR